MGKSDRRPGTSAQAAIARMRRRLLRDRKDTEKWFTGVGCGNDVAPAMERCGQITYALDVLSLLSKELRNA